MQYKVTLNLKLPSEIFQKLLDFRLDRKLFIAVLLYYRSTPLDEILQQLLEICEKVPGGIAVHCKADFRCLNFLAFFACAFRLKKLQN